MIDTVSLTNGTLEVEFCLPDKAYQGTRFDHGGIVKQIKLNAHTFLGKERTKAGIGTGGFGLMHGWLYTDARNYEGNTFSILGVGVLANNSEQKPYDFRQRYSVLQPCCISMSDGHEDSIGFLETQENAVISRNYVLQGKTLTITTTLTNTGKERLAVEEFNHNFFCFDNRRIGREYLLTTDYPLKVKVVRGHIELGAAGYRPLSFDEALGTTALTTEGYQQSKKCTTTLCNFKSRTKVTLTDYFTPSRTYHWLSPWSFCPEVFKLLELDEGRSEQFIRAITIDEIG
ncbi:MAG: hypothetical protein WCR02_08920 [Sphaerochaetaceae bacterium]